MKRILGGRQPPQLDTAHTAPGVWLQLAAADYQRALRLAPGGSGNKVARLNLAQTLLAQGRPQAALRQLSAFQGVVDPVMVSTAVWGGMPTCHSVVKHVWVVVVVVCVAPHEQETRREEERKFGVAAMARSWGGVVRHAAPEDGIATG